MKIKVAGTGLTKFGEAWDKSLLDLSLQASTQAITESGLKTSRIEAVYVANMLYGKLANQDQLGAVLSSALGLHSASFRVEAACASGGLAVHLGVQSILSGQYKNVLVVGAEKMTDASLPQISQSLMGAGSEAERAAGLTFPALYALMAKAHMQKYQTTRQHLSAVAVKNHYHATLNNLAQFHFELTEEKILESPLLSSPFTLYDASPISDGAAAVVLTAGKTGANNVYISASAVSSDTVELSSRNLTEITATKLSSQKAFKQAGVEGCDIKVAEVHDCFTIAEILAMEDIGFCQKGEGGQFVYSQHTKLGGRLPVNTSGGLKACGHPLAATGIKQIIEVTHQLQKRAGKRQVMGANIGLTHNVGGTGATVVVHILQT